MRSARFAFVSLIGWAAVLGGCDDAGGKGVSRVDGGADAALVSEDGGRPDAPLAEGGAVDGATPDAPTADAVVDGFACPVSDGGAPRPGLLVASLVEQVVAEAELAPPRVTGCLDVDLAQGNDEPTGLAVEAGGTLLVTLGHGVQADLGSLRRYDLATGLGQAEVAVGEEPAALALDAAGTTAWVALYRNVGIPTGQLAEPGALVEVDVAPPGLRVRRTIELGAGCVAAADLLLDEAAGTAAIACAGSPAVAVVDLAPGTVSITALGGPAGPVGGSARLVRSAAGLHAVTPRAGDVVRLDPSGRQVLGRAALGGGSQPTEALAVGGGSTILVGLDAEAALASIDAATGRVLGRIPLLPRAAPRGMRVTPDGATLLVADAVDQNGPGRLLSMPLGDPTDPSAPRPIAETPLPRRPTALVLVP